MKTLLTIGLFVMALQAHAKNTGETQRSQELETLVYANLDSIEQTGKEQLKSHCVDPETAATLSLNRGKNPDLTDFSGLVCVEHEHFKGVGSCFIYGSFWNGETDALFQISVSRIRSGRPDFHLTALLTD